MRAAWTLSLLFVLAGLRPAVAEDSPAPEPPTMGSVLAATTAADWQAVDADDLLVMTVNGKQVLIELADDFAPRHADNIRKLATQHYFDGLKIMRVQENYVVQWGDPAEEETARRPLGEAAAKLPAEFDRAWGTLPFAAIPDRDAYADQTGFTHGFPVGRDAQAERGWLLHCYAMVGAGRGNEADSSNGSELYVVSGHSPRHLDRNITLVGRVIEGMEALTVLPRGTGPLGFYELPEQYVPITSVRLASTLPEAERPRRERLRTESPAFARLIEARRHRMEPWFIHPVGRIEVCNVPIPVRTPQ
ncbi:MAG: peptidylprolyl isomerase [Xanthomonadales bacterium]|nr:peptidylprolyl isomerase [Xanthomonadales bacterium]